MRGATRLPRGQHIHVKFLLTRPMRGATAGGISKLKTAADFYSHAPCGARQSRKRIHTQLFDFYSHAPCGARRSAAEEYESEVDISTHTPHAGRDGGDHSSVVAGGNFYSHAPCGARQFPGKISGLCQKFLLTRPMRGATFWGGQRLIR